jgi:hypothetical protein
MIKIIRKLTKNQIDRGVIFSSTLSRKKTEQYGDTTHEVTEDNLYDCSPGTDKIKLLTDDSFFDDSGWNYNIIRK